MDQGMTDRSESVRVALLPFERIEESSRERARLGNFEAQVLQNVLQNFAVINKKQNISILEVCKNFNDPSFVWKQREQQNRRNFIFKAIRQFERRTKGKYPIISPESSMLLLWNFFMLTVLFYLLVQISLTVFFVPETYINLAVAILGLIFLFIDIIVRANIGVYKEGKYLTDRYQIFQQYARFQFWIDFFGWIVFFAFLVPQLERVKYLKMLFYVKIYTLGKIDSQIKNKIQFMRIRYAVYLTVRVLLIIIFILNWSATIYFAIDYYFYNQKGYYYTTGQLWLTNSISGNVTGTPSGEDQMIDIIQVYPWYVWYNYAMYWAAQTVSGVGYGNFTPKNPAEVAFVNICILISPIFFSFFINSIWEIVAQVQKSSVKYAENMKALKSFLKNMDLPAEMDTKIRDYYHQVWKNDDDQEKLKTTISDMLSKQLHKQFIITCKSRIFRIQMLQEISQSPYLRSSWNQIIELIAPNIQEEKLVEGEIIYDIGEKDQHIYYLFRGNVTLALSNNWITCEVIEGNNFGQQEFLTLVPRYHRAQASQYSKVAKLKSSLLRNTLKKSNFDLYEKFCFYKDQVIFLKKNSLLSVKCWKCESQQHCSLDCPSLNIQKLKMLRGRQKGYNQLTMTTYNTRIQYSRRRLKQRKIKGSTFNQYLRIEQPYQSQNYYKQYNIQ